MKTIVVKVPDPLDKKLRAAAKRRHSNKGTVIRTVLERYFAERTEQAVSCYDITKDLRGKFSGLPDLSHNKKYLKGFGQ